MSVHTLGTSVLSNLTNSEAYNDPISYTVYLYTSQMIWYSLYAPVTAFSQITFEEPKDIKKIKIVINIKTTVKAKLSYIFKSKL